MGDEKPVKVILNGKDQRRIKLPRPDIGEVKAVICSRFDVQSDISLVAIVSEAGCQEEYVISSSDDLKDLWEDFKELRVTGKQIDSGEITLTEGLRVIFNNDREDVKRITFTQHNIEDIKRVICERFFAEKVSLAAAIDGDNDKYSITTNDDVKEMWKSIVELHVTGKKKRLEIDMTVAINREQHAIDVVPQPYTAVVKKARQELGFISSMEDVDKSFRRMGDITNIAYYVAVATGNHDLQLGTKNLGFSAIELCNAADNTVQRYVLTCGTVNETFHTAIVYLLENDYDRALRMISSLEGTAQECTDKTEKLIAKIDKVGESKILSEETTRLMLKEREKAEEFEKEQKKKRLELEHTQWQIQDANKAKSGGIVQAVKRNFFRVVNVVATVASAAASVPKFLVSLGLAAAGYAADKEEVEEKKRDAERKRQEEERKKKEDAEKHRLQLSLDLKDLQRSIEEANVNDKCFHILGGELLKMRVDLATMKSFFEELLLFCQAIKKSEEQIMTNMGPGQKAEGGEVMKVNCRELFESKGFKEQLVNYQAKLTAQHGNHSRKSSAHLIIDAAKQGLKEGKNKQGQADHAQPAVFLIRFKLPLEVCELNN